MLLLHKAMITVATLLINLAGLGVLALGGRWEAPPAASSAASPMAPPVAPRLTPVPTPVLLAPGPHLFVDDYLIAASDNVTRSVQQPQRERTAPVIMSKLGRQTGQPFMSVIRGANGRFRIWYNAWRTAEEEADDYWGPGLATMESNDGIRWKAPLQRLDLPLTVSAGVLDEGPSFQPKNERYKLVYSMAEKPSTPNRDWLKTRVAFSADGIKWQWYAAIDTLFPGQGSSSQENWGDILNSYYDPIRRQYGLFFRAYGPYTWTNAEGVTQTEPIRRTGFITSTDFKQWTEPQIIFSPDHRDKGVTEWYGGPAAVQQRGDLMIGMLKVLRDDLVAKGAPQGAYGMGYTVLAWTRDGVTWQRDTEPFLAPDPTVGAWDHAHAWIDSVTAVGDELYLYYGGYKWGHKYEPQEDRQIGQVRMPRDRYVARQTETMTGTLRTPLVTLGTDYLSVNLDASQGWLEMQVLDDTGAVVSACDRLSDVNALQAPMTCSQPLSELAGEPVQLEFSFRNAGLYAFYLEATPAPTLTPAASSSPTSTPPGTPTATPSPSPSPSSTPSSTPSFTPTPTLSPTAIATPTPDTVRPLYLPLISSP